MGCSSRPGPAAHPPQPPPPLPGPPPAVPLAAVGEPAAPRLILCAGGWWWDGGVCEELDDEDMAGRRRGGTEGGPQSPACTGRGVRGEEGSEGGGNGTGLHGTGRALRGPREAPRRLPPALPIGDGGCSRAGLRPSLPAPASWAPGALPSPAAAHIVRLQAGGGGDASAASSCPRRRPGAAATTTRSPRRPAAQWHRAAPPHGRHGQGRAARAPIGRRRRHSAGSIAWRSRRSSLSANGEARGGACGGKAGGGKWDVAALRGGWQWAVGGGGEGAAFSAVPGGG